MIHLANNKLSCLELKVRWKFATDDDDKGNGEMVYSTIDSFSRGE